MRKVVPTLFVLAFLLVPAALLAQETQQAEPGVIVVQYFKCTDTEAFDDEIEENWIPHVESAMAEGTILGWGQLNHGWGDEWNRLLYTTATDLPAFLEVFGDLAGAALDEAPESIQRMTEACPEHKDNIYNVAHSLTPEGMGGQ